MSDQRPVCRILVVDDHGVVRRGVVSLLSEHPDLSVVGEAANGETAVRLAGELRPDVVIMDVRMPGIGGLEACRQVLATLPQTGVVFLTSFPDEDALVAAMLAGARGYVLKNLEDSSLVEGVRAVARGESFLDPSLGALVAQALRRLSGAAPATGLRPQQAQAPAGVPGGRAGRAAHSPDGLTPLELALLRLIADGRTNQEIADELNFAEKTIRNYVSVLLAKLQLHNRAEAAAYTVRHGLLDRE
ncbi:MAG TPA: response regulator transcription factor [Symbiobacteriaceae bacterium]|jgi:DNA-binding NarL/FixJ family response regulator|nr:response regulator transcription factor [Symbiobacteriaceae bacterium]